MLKESLKWMALTLIVAGLILLGVVLLARRAPLPEVSLDFLREPTAAPTATPTPTPTPTATPTPTPTATPTPLPVTAETWLTDYISSMSMEEKLGQMVLFGFSGTNTPADTYTAIQQDSRVGNIILYGANIESGDGDGGFARATELLNNCKSNMTTQIPPLVAIDIEGGKVVRFRWPSWPLSARTLGKRDAGFAYEQFLTIGQTLVHTGFNLNLAPVLDVSSSPMDTFLQTRIISADAAVAANIGAAVIEGLHDGGCLSTAKHFPGHGGTNADSHDTTPVVSRSREEMEGYDLVPFAAAIEAGVDCILVSHILYPALDETDIASMSQPIITDLLRGTMGFTGVVISDDFRMRGLTSRYEPGEAAVQFVRAGGDVIMCGAQYDRQRAIMKGLRDGVDSGELTEARIDESVFRILMKKMSSGVWSVELP